MSFLANIYQKFEQKLTKYFDSPSWRIKMTVWAVIFVLISFINNVSPLAYFSDYYHALKNHEEYFTYGEIYNRTIDWKRNWVYPNTGMNNRTFRLAMPFFAKVLHLHPISFWLYLFQLIFGFVMFYLLTNFLNKFFQNKLTTFYALIGLATIYFGTSFFIDFSGYSDFYSYFFLFLAIYFRKPLYIFAAAECAFWNDERAVVASGLVFLWWGLAMNNEQLTIKSLLKNVNSQMLAIVAAWGLYFAGRWFLTNIIGLNNNLTPSEFPINFAGNMQAFGFKFFWGLEGFWLAVLLFFFSLFYNKDYLRILLVGGAFLLMLLLSMTIYDTTRSTSFSFPIIFISMLYLKNYLTENELKKLFFLIAIICVLHPLATKTHSVGMFLM